MNHDEMDLKWKFEAFKAAINIGIEGGEVDMGRVWIMAKKIYTDGHKEGILSWKGGKVPATKEKKAAKPKKAKIKVVKGVKQKICPLCGENMGHGWKAHLFKKDGSPCGYKEE